EVLFVFFTQRYQLLAVAGQVCAVAQQEEQHVKHHAEADQQLCRVLPQADRLGGDELASGHRALGDFFLNTAQVTHAKIAEYVVGRRWKHIYHLAAIQPDIELSGTDSLVGVCDLLTEGTRYGDHRDNDDEQDDGQRGGSGQVAPALEFHVQPPLYRVEDDGQGGGPEQGCVIGEQYPDEADGDQCQHHDETAEIQARISHSGSTC